MANVMTMNMTETLSTLRFTCGFGLLCGVPDGSRSIRLAGSACSFRAAFPYMYDVDLVSFTIEISIPVQIRLLSYILLALLFENA